VKSDSLLDGPESTQSYWTTVNSAEAMPGVMTPLTASWYIDSCETALRSTYFALGILSRRRRQIPSDINERFMATFFGRVAMNVDVWRWVADRMPGTSGESVEQQVFGRVRGGVVSRPVRRRYPIIAIRMLMTALLARGRVIRDRRTTERWWRSGLDRLQDHGTAEEVLQDAYVCFQRVLTAHVTCSMLTQAYYQQVCALARRTGIAGLERSLVTGYGNFEEAAALSALWDISRGTSRMSLSDVVDRYGFIGSGELGLPSWRENRQGLADLVNRYRAAPDGRDPRTLESTQTRERIEAESRLYEALPSSYRLIARLMLTLARTHMPVREIGRANLLMAVDLGRAAARVLGGRLVAEGTLRDQEEIFLLTLLEIKKVCRGPCDSDLSDTICARKLRRSEYESITLPEAWQGSPVPLSVNTYATPNENRGPLVLIGVGVNAESVTGNARVVLDPLDCNDFEDGDVLVCATTDPSWSSLFLLAGAVVIDIGGPFSHGAIVARELGIPCVLNTRDGTRLIRDGDVVTVDGTNGTVTRLRAAHGATAGPIT
jgi:phosphohistidine swiveling domain-containing protein